MNDTVIKTIQLTKKYGNQTVVNKANLHVKQGRIYGLLGRNDPYYLRKCGGVWNEHYW